MQAIVEHPMKSGTQAFVIHVEAHELQRTPDGYTRFTLTGIVTAATYLEEGDHRTSATEIAAASA